jgi:hypothetical protein
MAFLRNNLLGICVALAGCATPVVYGPIGTSAFGYRDRQNPDGSHTILVVAPSATVAHQFWDQRAAELCGGAEYRKNIFRAEIPVVTTTGYAPNAYNPAYGASYTQQVYGALQLEGYLHCAAANSAEAPAADGVVSEAEGPATSEATPPPS